MAVMQKVSGAPRRTALVCSIIRSTVISSVFSWPYTVMPMLSPTPTMSIPAR